MVSVEHIGLFINGIISNEGPNKIYPKESKKILSEVSSNNKNEEYICYYSKDLKLKNE